MNANPEATYLPGALQELDDAIHRMTAPHTRVHRTDTTSKIISKPSLYAEMLASVQGAQGSALGGVARSMPPVWLDGVDWIKKVDSSVKEWWPSKGNTVSRLEELVKAGWRPQDTEQVQHMADSLTRWALEAESLLDGGRDSFALSAPCPACGESWVYKRDALGENVRVATLTVTGLGCNCLSCGHHWGMEYFTHLAAVIDCAPLEGVVSDDQ